MESTDKNLYCVTCSIVIFSIVLLLLSIAYFVFAIVGLINTSFNEESHLCNGSHLWIYSLVSLILLMKTRNTVLLFNNKEDEKNNLGIFIESSISLIMFIWGTYEFFCVNCVNNLYHTILYIPHS